MKIGNSWDEIIKEEIEKEYFKELEKFLDVEYISSNIFPPKEEIFRAFKLTDFDDVKVVILGQDPYHEKFQANGLAFSVNSGVKLPPSLKNIYKEIENEYGIKMSNDGDLSSWARQGILLLNTVLTVREGDANSHSKRGWEIFTDNIIKKLCEKKKNIVFVLWGNSAKKKKSLIDEEKNFVLEGVHPSPLSANRGFFGCGHFKKIDEILESLGEKKIEWKI